MIDQRVLDAMLTPVTLSKINPEMGYCYVVGIPPDIQALLKKDSDLVPVLYENGKRLKKADNEKIIRSEGGGRYYAWGRGVAELFYFASTDNSSPTNNQRSYTLLLESKSLKYNFLTDTGGKATAVAGTATATATATAAASTAANFAPADSKTRLEPLHTPALQFSRNDAANSEFLEARLSSLLERSFLESDPQTYMPEIAALGKAFRTAYGMIGAFAAKDSKGVSETRMQLALALEAYEVRLALRSPVQSSDAKTLADQGAKPLMGAVATVAAAAAASAAAPAAAPVLSVDQLIDKQKKQLQAFSGIFGNFKCPINVGFPEVPVIIQDHPIEQERAQLYNKAEIVTVITSGKCPKTNQPLVVAGGGGGMRTPCSLKPAHMLLYVFALATEEWIKGLSKDIRNPKPLPGSASDAEKDARTAMVGHLSDVDEAESEINKLWTAPDPNANKKTAQEVLQNLKLGNYDEKIFTKVEIQYLGFLMPLAIDMRFKAEATAAAAADPAKRAAFK